MMTSQNRKLIRETRRRSTRVDAPANVESTDIFQPSEFVRHRIATGPFLFMAWGVVLKEMVRCFVLFNYRYRLTINRQRRKQAMMKSKQTQQYLIEKPKQRGHEQDGQLRNQNEFRGNDSKALDRPTIDCDCTNISNETPSSNLEDNDHKFATTKFETPVVCIYEQPETETCSSTTMLGHGDHISLSGYSNVNNCAVTSSGMSLRLRTGKGNDATFESVRPTANHQDSSQIGLGKNMFRIDPLRLAACILSVMAPKIAVPIDEEQPQFPKDRLSIRPSVRYAIPEDGMVSKSKSSLRSTMMVDSELVPGTEGEWGASGDSVIRLSGSPTDNPRRTKKSILGDNAGNQPAPVKIFRIPAAAIIANILLLIFYTVCGAYLIGMKENWTPFRGAWFVFVSITTVGYGDVTPTSTEHLCYCLPYIVLGMSIFGNLLTAIVIFFQTMTSKFKFIGKSFFDIYSTKAQVQNIDRASRRARQWWKILRLHIRHGLPRRLVEESRMYKLALFGKEREFIKDAFRIYFKRVFEDKLSRERKVAMVAEKKNLKRMKNVANREYSFMKKKEEQSRKTAKFKDKPKEGAPQKPPGLIRRVVTRAWGRFRIFTSPEADWKV